MSDGPSSPAGIQRILRMSGAGPWILYALFALTHTTLAVLSGGRPMTTPWGWAALAAILLAAAWSIWPGPYPLPAGWAAGVVALLVFGATAVTWQLDPGTWPGYSSWTFGAVAFTAFALSLRGRTAAGWAGVLGMTLSAIAWSTVTAGDPLIGLNLSYRHLGTYLAGSLLALGVQRTARRIEEYRGVERRRAGEAAALEAGRAERIAEIEAVRSMAGPALRRIAAGRADHDPDEFRRLEAALRDRIRGRRLTRPPLGAAIDRARRRGVEVDVLDDAPSAAIDPTALRSALMEAAGDLDRRDAVDGPVTLRLALRDEHPQLTISSREGRANALPLG